MSKAKTKKTTGKKSAGPNKSVNGKQKSARDLPSQAWESGKAVACMPDTSSKE